MTDLYSPATVVELGATPLDALSIPATSIKVPLGPDRHAFVFTVSSNARFEMSLEAFTQLAQTLGNLVHPAPALLVVLPDGEELSAYRVEAE